LAKYLHAEQKHLATAQHLPVEVIAFSRPA